MLELGAFENFGFEILGVRFQLIYLVAIFSLKLFKYDKKELILISLLFFHCLSVGDLKSIGALILIIFWIKLFSIFKVKNNFKFIWIIYLLAVFELISRQYIASPIYSFRNFLTEPYDNRLTLTFSEPSFAGIYLAVLAIIMLKINKKTHFYILVILVFLTKSIGGIVLVIFSLFILTKKSRVYAVFLLIPLIIILKERVLIEIGGLGNLNAYTSIASRLNTWFIFIEYILSNGYNSLIGLGLGNLDQYLIDKYWFLKTEFSVGNFANGFLAIIMNFGLFCIPFFILLKKYSKSNVVFILMLFTLQLNGGLLSYITWLPLVLGNLIYSKNELSVKQQKGISNN